MSEYGFYGRLSASFPSQIIVDVTEVCNLACIHCPHPEFKKSEHYSARYLEPELNQKLAEEVRDHGRDVTQYIRYASEGEPLIHPRIYEMMAYAKKVSGVLISLTTNATLLTEKKIDKLLESGVDVVDTSLDAYNPETYAQIRVNGNLEVTRSNVLRLLQARDRSDGRPKVVVSYVEQPQNQRETGDFERFWKDQGADYVVIRRLNSCAGAKELIAEEMMRTAGAQKRRACLYPWERTVLSPRGMLKFCPQDWVNGANIADYRTTTLKEMWQGEFMQKLRQAHLTNDYSRHSFCGNCPDWKNTSWPGQGRSYADMMEEFQEAATP